MEGMQTVKSKDGVRIAVWMSGNGPYLVLVHGTSADHTRWAPVLPMLEEHFTVCVVDRRGRGGSGDSQPYSIDLEFDDVAAVCGSLDGPVHLLGHSYGALCSLESARITNNLGKLVLYEPALSDKQPAELLDRLGALLAQDERDAVLTTFFREVVRMSTEQIDALRSAPSWQARLEAAHTVLRECTVDDYEFDATRFVDVPIPTMLLAGGESAPFLKASTEAVHNALPNSHVVVMPGQGHVAIDTAPELFAQESLKFLLA